MSKHLIAILLILIFSSCKNKSTTKTNSLHKDSTSVVTKHNLTDTSGTVNCYVIEKDSVLILPFEIGVSLSPKAEERITKSNETIIVQVSFSGTPKDSANATFEEDGSFFVATASVEMKCGETARFDHIKFSKIIYEQLADKNIDLDVNVWSGRKSSSDNLLDCTPLFSNISKVVNQKFILTGKLLYGDD
jgi:hypothetical protein